MSKDWVRFNEYEDVLASTDLLASITHTLKKNSSFWKWTILAAHSGAQGALVCSVKDSTGTNILTKQSAVAMLNWLENHEGGAPREYLANFTTLLKKFQTLHPNSGLTGTQKQNLRRLNDDFRNNFVHFTPKGWGIEALGLPAIIGSALDLIEIAMQQHRVVVHLTGNMRRRLSVNLKSARSGLAKL
jgi:hypothetical protein